MVLESKSTKQEDRDNRQTSGCMNGLTKIWESPTFTTWGSQLAQSLRLLLVMPLIVTRFDETEIAAWYLFVSLNFFGTTVSQRISLTFTRMIAFAMGGATDLSPIKKGRPADNNGGPNWKILGQSFETVKLLNYGLAGVNTLVALVLGWIGLKNLMVHYMTPTSIWSAFLIFQGSTFLIYMWQHYQTALMGMNHIALLNRWEILFSLISITVGAIVLWCGGGIVALASIMQAFALLGVLRNKFIFHSIMHGRPIHASGNWKTRKKIALCAWEPIWRGFVGQIGSAGSQAMCLILATGSIKAAVLTNVLFSMRMIDICAQFSLAPIQSQVPLLTRMAGRNEVAKIRSIFSKRLKAMIGVYLIGILGCGLVLPIALDLIGSKASILVPSVFFAIGLSKLSERVMVSILGVSGFFNDVVGHWQIFFGGIVSVVSFYLLREHIGVWVFAVCINLPIVLMLGYLPFTVARNRIGFVPKDMLVTRPA